MGPTTDINSAKLCGAKIPFYWSLTHYIGRATVFYNSRSGRTLCGVTRWFPISLRSGIRSVLIQ